MQSNGGLVTTGVSRCSFLDKDQSISSTLRTRPFWGNGKTTWLNWSNEFYKSSDNIVSPLGLTSFRSLVASQGTSYRYRKHDRSDMSEQQPFMPLSLRWTSSSSDTKTRTVLHGFEQLLSIIEMLWIPGRVNQRTQNNIHHFFYRNINLLQNRTDSKKRRCHEETVLQHGIAEWPQFINKPVVISNACISGLIKPWKLLDTVQQIVMLIISGVAGARCDL